MLQYDSKVPYRKDDIVLYNGDFYICTALCCGVTPCRGSSVWRIYELSPTEKLMLNPAPLFISSDEFGTYAERVVNNNLVDRLRDAFDNGSDIYITSEEGSQYHKSVRNERMIAFVNSEDFGGHNEYVMISTESNTFYVFKEDDNLDE